MFGPMRLCVCKREKERGFEKLGTLCKVFFFFLICDFFSLSHKISDSHSIQLSAKCVTSDKLYSCSSGERHCVNNM